MKGRELEKFDVEYIKVRGAKQHNLKNVDIDIPKNQFVVITGLSGSGKSSLAFDTVYAEGQRRYVESLSSYARQFLEMQDKPDVESITGLSPSIAIDQKTTSKNPRSTVATITEIYDYMRLLYARIGVPYSPKTGLPIEKQTVSQMAERICELPERTKIYVMAPLARGQKGEFRKEFEMLRKEGYTRVIVDNQMYELDGIPKLDKHKAHNIQVVVDRLVASKDPGNRLVSSVETACNLAKGWLQVKIVQLPDGYKGDLQDEQIISMSEHFSCPESGFEIGEIEPRMFSFNSPYGACPECDGLGTEMSFDLKLIIPDRTIPLLKGAIAPWNTEKSKHHEQTIIGLSKHYGFSSMATWNELGEDLQKLFLYGSGEEEVAIEYEDDYKVYNVTQPYEGILPNLERRYAENSLKGRMRESYFERFMDITDCRSCDGHRLKKETLAIKIDGKNIGEAAALTIEEARQWTQDLPAVLTKTENAIADKILNELYRRLSFLQNVGLGYLTLNRRSGTLSGGESQRIRLASQIGAGLSGVLYVLDEPSIGLHQSDNDKLIATLKDLKELGNTVIVVEHDEDTMLHAQHLVDIGPGAGVHGGNVIAQGTPQEVMDDPNSVTGAYLAGRKFIEIPERRKYDIERAITVVGARGHNLKNITASIPLKTFTSVTGVSGGGKSTLIIQTLYKALAQQFNGAKKPPAEHDKIEGLEYIDKIIQIDQSPIGRTPRSNPATYTGAFAHIRDWYVALPEAKARGYKSGRFSFNVKGGRCETCTGDGMIKIEMHFLPDVYVKCESCDGKRYNKETLEILYKGKSISDVLNMTVDDAADFFKKMPQIYEKIAALQEVGLGYIRLGQPATTLSGGEAQRVKLAKELSKRSTGRTLYILDEPTTGLHSADIEKLLKVLHRLVDVGNTVLVIEHNLDVVKTSDYVIDIGPNGGDKGGKLVATGTPEDVMKVKESITGQYLKKLMKRNDDAQKAA